MIMFYHCSSKKSKQQTQKTEFNFETTPTWAHYFNLMLSWKALKEYEFYQKTYGNGDFSEENTKLQNAKFTEASNKCEAILNEIANMSNEDLKKEYPEISEDKQLAVFFSINHLRKIGVSHALRAKNEYNTFKNKEKYQNFKESEEILKDYEYFTSLSRIAMTQKWPGKEQAEKIKKKFLIAFYVSIFVSLLLFALFIFIIYLIYCFFYPEKVDKKEQTQQETNTPSNNQTEGNNNVDFEIPIPYEPETMDAF